jgi:3-oxoacyl-[acyl-carrier protein] reductase
MVLKLKDNNVKTVVVTGATKGLGFNITKRCIEEGYIVIAIGRYENDEFNDLLQQHQHSIFFEKYDFENTDGIHEFSKIIIEKYGRPWGLVNNAAIGLDGILATMSESDIKKIIKINIEAPILFTKYMVRPMMINKKGRIINITSITAHKGYSGLSVYSATKAAFTGFSKSLAREIGELNITVNNIAPGFVNTSMVSKITKKQRETIIKRSALKSMTEPEDISEIIAYILSEHGKNITGTTITIDAGSTV